jgi:sulfur carrier protein
MIDITINGDDRRVPHGTTVDVLVAERAASPRGVAVAVNGAVVPRSAWDTTALHGGDRIELLRASQGG